MRNCRFFKLHRRQLFCDIKQPRLFYSPGVKQPKAGVKQPKPHPQKRNKYLPKLLFVTVTVVVLCHSNIEIGASVVPYKLLLKLNY